MLKLLENVPACFDSSFTTAVTDWSEEMVDQCRDQEYPYDRKDFGFLPYCVPLFLIACTFIFLVMRMGGGVDLERYAYFLANSGTRALLGFALPGVIIISLSYGSGKFLPLAKAWILMMSTSSLVAISGVLLHYMMTVLD